MSKKYFYFLSFFVLIFSVFNFSQPQNTKASDVCSIDNSQECESTGEAQTFGDSGHTDACDKTIYVFYGEECSHCRDFEKYLSENILKNHPEIKVERLEVWHNSENYQKMLSLLSERGIKARSVPTVIVGHQVFVGYASDELSGREIKQSIYDLYCIDEKVEERSLQIPLIGAVNISSLSVPILTIVLGLIDGFNPCAMWALVALITILIATKDRKKIRLVGSIFLLSSWLIYYLFMVFYLNTFKFLAFATFIRYIIGALAIFAGAWYLNEFRTYQPGVCKVTSSKKQKSILEKMKSVANRKSLILIILGAIALAVSVNLIEMVCSIGLPVIYTQILSLSNLPAWQHYLYLALYNTLYMADDIIVFIIAAKTLNFVQLNHKYDRAMKLVGGLLIIALGLILIFRPEFLGS